MHLTRDLCHPTVAMAPTTSWRSRWNVRWLTPNADTSPLFLF